MSQECNPSHNPLLRSNVYIFFFTDTPGIPGSPSWSEATTVPWSAIENIDELYEFVTEVMMLMMMINIYDKISIKENVPVST